MSLAQRFWHALVAIPTISIERGISYFLLAGFAWLTLHVALTRWVAHRRISAKVPTARQMSREVLYSLRSLVVYGLVGGLLVFAVRSRWTLIYFRIEAYGWTWFCVSVGLCMLIHDTYFYWTHRLMHHPKLFRLFHHTHHLSTNPSPWAAYSFSPLEAVVQAGIAPLLAFVLPLHPLALSVFLLLQISYNVLGHCGFELYPTWFVRSWCGRIMNTTTHHSQHHETNHCNYGLYFNFWDHLLGTNHGQYVERFEDVCKGAKRNAPAS